MKNLIPLMQREWLQHRFAWALLVLVPLALSMVLLGLGTIELDAEMTARRPSELSLVLTMITSVVSAVVLLLLLGVTSLFIALGSPRRDDGDRSIEFWLSLPSGHAESLLAPMLVHLLLVPVAALLLGLVVSVPVSALVVGRVVGLGEWLALPWGTVLGAAWALAARAVAGLPLALLWLLPLVLAAMLANAFFRRWGLPLLVVVLLLLAQGLEKVFGEPVLVQTLSHLLSHAASSVLGAAGEDSLALPSKASVQQGLLAIPAWAWRDWLAALQQLLQPALLGACAVSAGFFAALVAWRQRLASLA